MVWFLLTMGVQDGAVIGASAGLVQLIPRHTERCRDDYSSLNAISIRPSGERMDGSTQAPDSVSVVGEYERRK